MNSSNLITIEKIRLLKNWGHAFRNYTNAYGVENLNAFNP